MKFSAFVVSCLFFLFSFFYFTPASFAQTKTAPTSNISAANISSNVPNNLHNWTQTVMIEVMSSLTCQIAGVDPINPKQPCLGADQKTGKIGFLPSNQTGGAIGFMGNMITTLYTPPLHTADYFKSLAANFGINKKAYAQAGTGFDSLKPLMNIWVAFRNIVYLILVIIFVVIGLAIMLRVKIDPRTVMTIQNQIPKIIVGILAVTFSFAISGFLIDLMWVFIYLIYNVITQAAGHVLINPAGLQGGTPFGVMGGGNNWSILWNATWGVGSTIANFLGFDSATTLGANAYHNMIHSNTNIFAKFGLSMASGLLGGLVQIISSIVGFVGGIICFVIFAIALLVALFRVWFSLIKAYVMILLDVVLAPFWIIGGIIPGSPISLSGWFKDISANLLAFPATIAMFMFAVLFKDIFAQGSTQYFFPPLIGTYGDITPKVVGALISFGIVLMTPNVVNMLKQALKAPKTDMGIGISSGVGTLTGGLKTAGGIYTASKYNAITGEAWEGKEGAKGRAGRIITNLMQNFR